MGSLLKHENKKKLVEILTVYVVSSHTMASDLQEGQELANVEGGKLKVSVKNGKVMIMDANVTISFGEGSNAVVHIIDKVLMPHM